MNAEIKAKRVAALRSGKYKQGRHNLKTTDGEFCCLGVLCEIVAPGDWRLQPEMRRYIQPCDAGAFPPSEVLARVGIDDDELAWPLAGMNDDGQSFAEIADFIEKNF